MSRAVRGEGEPEEAAAPEADDEEGEASAEAGTLGQERYAEMGAAEQFILAVSENGYGKRTSSFEYRIDAARRQRHRRHGGQRAERARWSPPSRSRTATRSCCVTDGGQIIRMPVGDDKPIRIIGRGTQGVTLFDTAGREGRVGRASRGRCGQRR